MPVINTFDYFSKGMKHFICHSTEYRFSLVTPMSAPNLPLFTDNLMVGHIE